MLLLVPILMLGSSVPHAPDTARTRWPLADYLALVESANPELIAARARSAAADARIGPAGRPSDPMLELGLMNRSLPRFGRRSPLAMDQVRIGQTVPAPGKLGASTGAARERAGAEEALVEEARTMLRWRTSELAIDLDRVDRTAALIRQSVPMLRGLEDVARARYAVGQAQQSDVLRAQLESARLVEELMGLEAERQATVAQLNAIARRAPSLPIDAVSLPPIADSVPVLAVLVDRALRDRPLLSARRGLRKAAAFDRRRSELERWPDLDLGLAYGQQPMFGGSGTDRMLSLTIGATVPIWSGSRQRQWRREAEAMEQMAAADIEMVRVETESRLGQLVAQVERDRRLMMLYRATVLPETRAAAASALSGYRTGVVDFEATLAGQLAVIRAETEVVRLASGRIRALAEIEYLSTLPLVSAGGVQ